MSQALRERIAAARHDFSTLDETRRRANAALARLLTSVEERFAARATERDHLSSRVSPLADANRTLAGLVDRLAGRAETTAASDRAAMARLAGLAGRYEDVGRDELARENGAVSF